MKIYGEKQKKGIIFFKCDRVSESFLKTIDLYQAYKNLKNIYKTLIFDIVNTHKCYNVRLKKCD